ncbi:MAG: hypothetical protein B6U94_01915 [Thermofilum sp. ex4484_79]|nr:MAG: hypothetical protein B6U94_01915 [Thermofilum sp. ex4484_79]
MDISWDETSWPLMEEEILILEKDSLVSFNFPYKFFRKYLKTKINVLKPIEIKRNYNTQGGKRIIVKLDKEKALELRAWLTLHVQENSNFFITEIEEIE